MEFARILDQNDAVGGFGDFREQRVGKRGLAGRGAAGDEDVGAGCDRVAQCRRRIVRHDSGADIVFKREDRDSGFADREDGRGDHGRQQPFEPLPCSWQLCGHTRGSCMDLRADMVRNQTDDALAVSGGELYARISEAVAQPVDPKTSVRIEHHLDNRRVFEPCGDVGPQRRSEHACATGERFGLECVDDHWRPRV